MEEPAGLQPAALVAALPRDRGARRRGRALSRPRRLCRRAARRDDEHDRVAALVAADPVATRRCRRGAGALCRRRSRCRAGSNASSHEPARSSPTRAAAAPRHRFAPPRPGGSVAARRGPMGQPRRRDRVRKLARFFDGQRHFADPEPAPGQSRRTRSATKTSCPNCSIPSTGFLRDLGEGRQT